MPKTATPSLHDLIAKIAIMAVKAGQPSELYTGTVHTTNPLSILVEDKFLLPYKLLTLTNAVSDHEVDITVSMTTENNTHKHETDGDPTHDHTHNHQIKGRKKIIIHNGLKEGEKVVLVREQGGQNFIVLDRLSKYKPQGEWND